MRSATTLDCMHVVHQTTTLVAAHGCKRADSQHTLQMYMVGDSLVRYQFLALAYFVVWGACPRPQHPERLDRSNFLLDKWSFAKPETYCDHVTDVLTSSSRATWTSSLHLQENECSKHPEISKATFQYNSTQACRCSCVPLYHRHGRRACHHAAAQAWFAPLQRPSCLGQRCCAQDFEQALTDATPMQGSFQIVFETYYTGSLRNLILKRPPDTTHVVFGFGAWLKSWKPLPDGPDMNWICGLFTSSRPYSVVWMSPPPKRRQDNTVAAINAVPERPYNVQACCAPAKLVSVVSASSCAIVRVYTTSKICEWRALWQGRQRAQTNVCQQIVCTALFMSFAKSH